MKSSWFSLFSRKDRHRGTVNARDGLKSGCIWTCPVCEKPLTQWEREHNLQWRTGFNEIVKSFENKPDRIYMTMNVTCSLSGSWGSNQNYPHIICSICYLTSLQHTVDRALEQARGDRAREAYDAELDCEILTDSWGVTKEDFENVAKCRGDI